jgi:hypothetical protein
MGAYQARYLCMARRLHRLYPVWLELRQSDGRSLIVSVPAGQAAVLKYFQGLLSYGIVVPDDPS